MENLETIVDQVNLYHIGMDHVKRLVPISEECLIITDLAELGDLIGNPYNIYPETLNNLNRFLNRTTEMHELVVDIAKEIEENIL